MCVQVLTGSDKEDDFDYNGVTRRFIGQLLLLLMYMYMYIYYLSILQLLSMYTLLILFNNIRIYTCASCYINLYMYIQSCVHVG